MSAEGAETVIIDFHTHNFPDALAARAVEVMCGKLAAGGHGDFHPVGDGTLATQLRDMDRAGVDLSVNCPVCTLPHNFDAILRRALDLRGGKAGAAAAERNFQLGSVHPADPDFRAHVRLLKEHGFPGVKIHPQYMGVLLDNPAYTPFFAELRDQGLFVLSHTGYDPGFPGASDAADPARIAALLTAVPGLKFVAAHLGGECRCPAHATDVLLPFETCWIDTAAMYWRDDAAETRRIAAEWPADRMVFGTDYFWRDEAHLLDWVRTLRPDPADQARIFHLNAAKLLGLPS